MNFQERVLRLIPGMYPRTPKRNVITILFYLLSLGYVAYLFTYILAVYGL